MYYFELPIYLEDNDEPSYRYFSAEELKFSSTHISDQIMHIATRVWAVCDDANPFFFKHQHKSGLDAQIVDLDELFWVTLQAQPL